MVRIEFQLPCLLSSHTREQKQNKCRIGKTFSAKMNFGVNKVLPCIKMEMEIKIKNHGIAFEWK